MTEAIKSNNVFSQIISKAFWKKVIPSKSSMVFSSLATVLSANSARVSACVTHTDL